MQSRLPDILIRRIVGVLAIAIAVQFLWSGLS
jgi:small neutral amino acid transporter SnatA (MarC family)